MSPAEIALVQKSWALVVPIADQAAELFYRNLFEASPELRPLFGRADMVEQRKKLVAALAVVVKSLNQFEILRPTLTLMGEKHAGYGVQEKDYAAVGSALIATLRLGLGDHFTPQAAVAWQKAYTAAADAMIAGAAQRGAA